MADNLDWMNRHAVLLKESQWANIAAKENYKIRPDLRPIFDAHPDSLELLDAMAAQGLYREGCEFIARMTHRRAAVWWGYCCLLDLFEERKEVETGAVKSEPTELELMLEETALALGFEVPKPGSLDDIDNFCKVPRIDWKKLLETPKPPPQDATALKAASAAVKGKIDAIDRLIPPVAQKAFADARAVECELSARALGGAPEDLFRAAMDRAKASPLTYTIDRTNSPTMQKILKMQDELERMRRGIIAQIKAAFPEKFPPTPEAKLLLAADAKKRSDDAVQAVWRWIVSPDERNTSLAMEAANAVPGTPESMLAMTAAWSFGDLAPEGKMMVPVPPELPGMGLNSFLLMLALDPKGHRKMPERYERYFKMGMDVIFGKNLWTEAVGEKLSPHAKLEEKFKS